MKDSKNDLNKSPKLRNYSQPLSMNRFFELDSEITSQIVAGGDEEELRKDIEDDEDA